MNEGDKKKIKRNLVALEKKLKLDDQFLRLSVQKRMFSQEMIDDIMEEDSPTLDYCMKLMLRGPKAFSRFIDALIETGQNDIVRLLAPNIDVRSFSGSNALGVSMRNVPVPELVPSTSAITRYTGDSFAETEKLYHPPRPLNSTASLDIPMTSHGLASSLHTSTSSVSQPPLCQPASAGEQAYNEEDDDLQHADNGVLIFHVKSASPDFYLKKNKSMRCYPVTLSKKRGRVLIININSFDNNLYDARAGSETDVCNLDNLFQQLNFIVTLKQDVNAEQFIMEIESFAQREDHKEYSSCFIFLMSHGADLGNGHWGIVAKDGIKIDVEELIAKFSNKKAKSLIEKPKIIVINACRGDTSDRGVAHPIPYVPEGLYKKPRLYKDGNNESADDLHRAVDDMTIFKSTVPGYASHREEKYGSWLVTSICHIFAQRACDKDVCALFRLTDEKIKSIKGSENQRQTAEIISRGMNKELYLYPGL